MGHDDEKLRVGVSNRAESCDAESPISRSTIQLGVVEPRSDEQTSKGPDGAGNSKLTVLPQPFRTLLHCGMSYLFLDQLGARVHDWVSVCLSSAFPDLPVTPEEFKFFIKDLICKGEAFGMDFYPRPRCSLWPRIYASSNKYKFEVENVLVLAELAKLLRYLESNGEMVQLVLIVLPHVWEGDHQSLPQTLMDIRIFCEEHGVIYHECFTHEVRNRSNEYVDCTAWKIKKEAVYLDSIKKSGGDSKAAGLCKEIDENVHHVDASKEIGGDGGSKERLDVHASGSPNVSDDETQEDDSGDKEQGMSHLFPVQGIAQVHDWVSVCLSSKFRNQMVTHEEFKFFIRDLVLKGEAIGMDFYPLARCSLWPRIFAPTNNMSMFELENVLVLAELAELLRYLEINGEMVQLVLIVLPHVWEGDYQRLLQTLMDIRIFCEEHGVIYHECFSHEVRKRSSEYMDCTAWKIKKQEAVYLDSIKKSGGDSKAAGLCKEIAELSKACDGETKSEDELSKAWDGGFHGSIDEVEFIAHNFIQVNKMGNVKSWACISFSMNLKATRRFLVKLVGTLIDVGMGFYPMAASCVHAKSGSFADVEEALWHMHDTISEILSVRGHELGLLLVILPVKKVGDEIYGKIEKVCEKLGFVYQCCLPEDARRPSEVYLKATAYEINNKVVRRDAGTLLCNFVMPFSAKEDDPTIVFGADIFRDSNMSIAAVVATFDWPVSNRYSAFVTEQPYKEATIKKLYNEKDIKKSMVRACLLVFSKKTKVVPGRIIFFRNGVDEGQLRSILSQEIGAIQKACTSIYTSTVPITYVVVGRAESAVGEDSCSTKFEFSCSHPVVGGTTTVAYRVLHDENEYDADGLQSLCTKLCTERIRWADPEISVAPPAYYARLAASRGHARLAASRAHAHAQQSYDGESTTSARQPPPVR